MAANGSFETGPSPGDAMTLAVGSTVVPGWVVTRNPIEYIETRWNASEGVRSFALNGSSPGGIAQTFATVPGGEYTLTFWMAGDAFSAPVIKNMRVEAGESSSDYQFDASHSWPWGMGWLQQQFIFTAEGGSTMLEFRSLDPGDVGPTIDDVVITGPTVDVPSTIHGRAMLRSPRPNPAAGRVWIDYALATEAPIRLSVADVQGREIQVLAEGRQPAGWQVQSWDGSTAHGPAPAGLYFIRLAAPGVHLVRKVVLSR